MSLTLTLLMSRSYGTHAVHSVPLARRTNQFGRERRQLARSNGIRTGPPVVYTAVAHTDELRRQSIADAPPVRGGSESQCCTLVGRSPDKRLFAVPLVSDARVSSFCGAELTTQQPGFVGHFRRGLFWFEELPPAQMRQLQTTGSNCVTTSKQV